MNDTTVLSLGESIGPYSYFWEHVDLCQEQLPSTLWTSTRSPDYTIEHRKNTFIQRQQVREPLMPQGIGCGNILNVDSRHSSNQAPTDKHIFQQSTTRNDLSNLKGRVKRMKRKRRGQGQKQGIDDGRIEFRVNSTSQTTFVIGSICTHSVRVINRVLTMEESNSKSTQHRRLHL